MKQFSLFTFAILVLFSCNNSFEYPYTLEFEGIINEGEPVISLGNGEVLSSASDNLFNPPILTNFVDPIPMKMIVHDESSLTITHDAESVLSELLCDPALENASYTYDDGIYDINFQIIDTDFGIDQNYNFKAQGDDEEVIFDFIKLTNSYMISSSVAYDGITIYDSTDPDYPYLDDIEPTDTLLRIPFQVKLVRK